MADVLRDEAAQLAALRREACDVADVAVGSPEGDLVMRGVTIAWHRLIAALRAAARQETTTTAVASAAGEHPA